MMARWCWIIWVAGVVAVSGPVVQAQERPAVPDWGAYRDTIDAFQPPPYRLRPFVLPGSEQLYLNGTPLDSTQYRIDYRHGRVWLERDRLRTNAELVAIYRTYPFRFADAYQRRQIDSTMAPSGGGRRVVAPSDRAAPAAPTPSLPGFTLERSGSISRGIIAGSNRDVNIESGLRMQLAGPVAEGVSVRAVLSDANTPIQPEGTTQRLNNFDRVFMEVEAPVGTAQLGDIQVDYTEAALAPFSRKLQGARVQTASLDMESGGLTRAVVRAVGATTRGQFRSQDIVPVEGVQGPYRLEGSEGERFIIVIAGSERVYLDGERLTRGETNDYVIDYAQAEITFTARRLITAERRITVEFEYTTTGFDRTLVGADATLGWGRVAGETPRLEVGATFLREADDRTFSDAFDLSPEDSLLLEAAGDAGAVRSGAEVVSFDPEAPYVQYRRTVRTAPDGRSDTIFVALDRAPADTTTVYRVRFSRVGPGAGRYERVGRSVNGIVYEYRGPGGGDYAPVRRLPQPVHRQVMDVRGRLHLGPHLALTGEWASSLNDQNRFSSLDAADDRGQAYEAGLQLDALPLGGAGTLSAEVRRRTMGAHFAPLNRVRPVEYGRRWNVAERGIPTRTVQAMGRETIDEARIRWAVTPSSYLETGAGRLQLGDGFRAQRQHVGLQLDDLPTGAALAYTAERVTSTDAMATVDGSWLRQRGRLQQSLGAWTPHVAVEHERRLQRAAGTDSLTRDAFAFVEVRPGVDVGAGALQAGAHLALRSEQAAAGGDLRPASRAWTVQSHLTYRPSRTLQTNVRLGLRTRRSTDYFRLNAGRQDRESVLLRWKGTARPFDGALEVEGFYDALTERTPTQQEIYVRTGPELGQYVWTDDNDDGIIQLDEFVPETTPNEGTYVQRFVPSDSLIPVATVQTRLRVQTHPGRVWQRASAWWKRALARVATRTTIELREKSRSGNLTDLYLLRPGSFRQPGITLDGQVRVRQDVYLFRRAGRYGLDMTVDQLRGLSERAAGLQTRFRHTWQVAGTYRLGPAWSLEIMAQHQQDRLASRAFASRSYDIESLALRPDITWRLGGGVQVTGGARISRKRDAVGPRTARLLRFPLEVQWARPQRFALTGRVEVADVQLDGAATGLARFELTDGRGPGTSTLWRLSGRYRFSERLRATLSYDGRAPADAPTVNSVRVQMSASF